MHFKERKHLVFRCVFECFVSLLHKENPTNWMEHKKTYIKKIAETANQMGERETNLIVQ